MKKTIILAMAMSWAPAVHSQSFCSHWISAQQVDSTSEIWFRQQIRLQELPAFASATIATTGKVDVYINERNVSTAIWIPDRTGNDDRPVSVNMEVTRFLQPGVNTIAIWYSPSFPHINGRQIAFSLCGRMKNGEKRAFCSDDGWLARRANASLANDGGERYDANAYTLKWNSDDVDWGLWQPARDTNTPAIASRYHLTGYPAVKRDMTYTPRYFDLAGDSVYYQFDKAFKGQLRITLRNARRGQKIYVDGLEYTCSGEMDEQACRKFTVADYRRVLIHGDRNFRNEQIQSVEGLEIVPYFHDSLQY